MILLRSAAFNVVLYGTTAVLTICVGMPLALFAPGRMLALARFWAWLQLKSLQAICGIRLVVTGRAYLPADGSALIASQHQSAFDTIVWLVLLPRCCYVVKQELTRIPLFGIVLRGAGMISIDRSAPLPAIRRLMREGRQAAAGQRQIIIFPEGTRAGSDCRLPLQPGVAALAAATGLPVIPVATDSGRCWSRRAFRKLPGEIHIAVQPPIGAGLPRDELMRALDRALDRGEREIAAGG